MLFKIRELHFVLHMEKNCCESEGILIGKGMSSMNAVEPVWLNPLRKLLNGLCSPQPGREGLAQLMTSIAELDALLLLNRAEMPVDLIHFLERRSYEKAVRYCEGALSIPRGTCGAKN